MDFTEKPDEALRRFLSRQHWRTHAREILRRITKQYTTGRIADLREKGVEEAIEGLIDKAVKEEESTALENYYKEICLSLAASVVKQA